MTTKGTGPGQGAGFETTPQSKTHVDPEGEAIRVNTQEAGSPPLSAASSTRRILVVDDDEDAAATLALLLEMSGYEVRVAHDGQQALRIAASTALDVVLLDLGLPGMNGFEVARRLREFCAPGSTRLLALTGYGRDSDRRAALEAGFEAHLVKPVEFEELIRVIDARA